MSPDTSGDVAVVKGAYVLEEAYKMAHNEFSDVETDEGDDRPFDLSPFKGSARWANHVAPRLRAMAGYADSGPGTYTVERQVAVIRSGCEEDEPAEANLMDARHVHQALVEAYDAAAYDAAEDTFDPDSVQHLL